MFVDGESLVGESRDISIGGVFIDGVSATFGKRLTVQFGPSGSSDSVRLPGVVRWIGRDGIGIRFGLLGARDTHLITQIDHRSQKNVMTLDEAMQWLASQGGKVRLVKRTADDNYYQIVIPPHRSVMIGVAHHGKVEVEPSDPNFEHAFIQMVEDIRSKVRP